MSRLSVNSNDQPRKKSEFIASNVTSIIEEDSDIEYSSDEDVNNNNVPRATEPVKVIEDEE